MYILMHTHIHGCRHGHSVMETEAAAKSLLDSYLFYKTRSSLQLEGFTYTIGDFRIRISRATSRPSNKFVGIVVDVEGAVDCAAVHDVVEMLKEAVPGGEKMKDVVVQEEDGGMEGGGGRLGWGVALSALLQVAVV